MSDAPALSPVRSDPVLDGDHERMAHIVLEGFEPDEGDYVSAGPTVVEGLVNGTPVKALCGKVWVPSRDPKRYPVCPTCKEIYDQLPPGDDGGELFPTRPRAWLSGRAGARAGSISASWPPLDLTLLTP